MGLHRIHCRDDAPPAAAPEALHSAPSLLYAAVPEDAFDSVFPFAGSNADAGGATLSRADQLQGVRFKWDIQVPPCNWKPRSCFM